MTVCMIISSTDGLSQNRLCMRLKGNLKNELCVMCMALIRILYFQSCFTTTLFNKTIINTKQNNNRLHEVLTNQQKRRMKSFISWARGMAVYVRDGYGAFCQPKFDCGCCEMLVFKVCGARQTSTHSVCIATLA